MTAKEQLKQWMENNGRDYRSVADATGDTYSAVHMMVNGKREINDAFKWRFAQAFGHDVAKSVFGSALEAVAPVVELQAEQA